MRGNLLKISTEVTGVRTERYFLCTNGDMAQSMIYQRVKSLLSELDGRMH